MSRVSDKRGSIVTVLWAIVFVIGWSTMGAGQEFSGAVTAASAPLEYDRNEPDGFAPQPRSTQPRVIVQTKGPVSDMDIRTVTDAGGHIETIYKHFHGFTAILPLNGMEVLQAADNVFSIVEDRKVYGMNDLTTEVVHADLVESRYGLTGRGVTIAFLDSGIAKNEDLQFSGNYMHGRVKALVNLSRASASPFDEYGHGTHVAGTAGGSGYEGFTHTGIPYFRGVAPGADIVSVKVLGDSGSGYMSDVIRGLDWCIEHKRDYGIRIINISLGTFPDASYTVDPLCQAVEQAWKEGIVVVVAAGNLGRLDLTAPPGDTPREEIDEESDEAGDEDRDAVPGLRRNREEPDEMDDSYRSIADYTGYGTITTPGIDPYVITVGALNTVSTVDPSDDVITSYSSRGPTLFDHVLKPDLVAPGNRIISLRAADSFLDLRYPDNRVSIRSDSPEEPPLVYTSLSGTSMASAVVSGAAAILLEKEPWLTPDTVKARLMKSARKLPANAFVVGAGSLDISAALATQGDAETALSPSCVLGRDNRAVIMDVSNLWGDRHLWAISFIWADSFIWAENFIWADSNIWSENFIWADTIPAMETIISSGD
jgi:serine protease AprX